MNTAVVFPGQGAQSVGMGCDVADASARARSIFHRAGDVLGFDVADLCFNGPAEKLGQTDIQQPAIFVTSVAIWEALLEAGARPEWFSHAAGLSLGEYSALYAAGAVGFEEGLRLVRRRGELMQEAALASPSGMVSLVGADEETARAVCQRARGSDNDVLAPANFNCPGQIVISGGSEACRRAVEVASEMGCRAVAMAVAGAFHSPLMAPAAEGLCGVLAETPFTRPAIPVIANVDASEHLDAAAIRDSLKRQVTEPVLWLRCVQRMIAEGVERFVEIGPGRVLTGLLRKIDRTKKGINVASADAIAQALREFSG